MNFEQMKSLANELYIAEKTATPIKEPISSRFENFTVKEAYEIQKLVIDLKKQDGMKLVGKKIGFTSEKLREQYGVTEPDFGVLMDNIVLYEGENLSFKKLISPRIEGEISFVLKEDLAGKDITPPLDVYKATDFILPSIEIVDSRFENWNMKLEDSIADNASNSYVMLGLNPKKLDEFDLRTLGLVLSRNGKVMETGAGAAVFDHPLKSVAWLANQMIEMDMPLRKNEIIMSGSFTRVFDVVTGDVVEANFGKLGKVSLTIGE